MELALAVGKQRKSISQRLSQLDWSFNDREKATAVEAIHPYPAKFIGEIPRAFIQHLPLPAGTRVFDPFCGSGTSLVEAQRAGLDAIGIDLNPIACLISRVKTAPLASGFPEAVTSLVEAAGRIKSLPSSGIPNVDHWFKQEVQLAVGALAKTIALSKYQLWLDPLRLALSSILVRVSNQDSDTRYAAVSKKVSYEDVFAAFAAAASKLRKALESRAWMPTNVQVLECDTLEVKPDQVGAVGLVVTSPPYPNAYEYWLYHKYRMWWLGFDPIAVKEKEIGARAHFFKKNHHTAERFVDQMQSTFELIDGALVRQGYVCFVVGRSKIHGKIIDNGDIIEEVAGKIGYERVARFDRAMNDNRKSFNLSHANIKKETVLVLQKP